MKAAAVNYERRPGAFDFDAKIPQTFQRAFTIDAFRKIVDCGRAFGYCGKHRKLLTDGFISGHRRYFTQSLGWLDFQTIHRRRLGRSLTLHKPRVTKRQWLVKECIASS